MKTIKQIADELHVDKQKVYRFVKQNHINEAHQSGQTKYFDEVAEKRIKSHFSEKQPNQRSGSEPHHDMVYDALIKQLETKDKQIEQLQKLLDQEQQLRMVAESRILSIEEKEEPTQKRTWKWWRKD